MADGGAAATTTPGPPAPASPGAGKVQVEALGRVLDLTPRRIQQLAKEGVFPKAERGWYPLVPCIQAYIKYWQQRAAQPDRESGSRAAILEAKTRLTRAAAQRQELEVQDMLHSLLPASLHFAAIEQILAQVANQLKTSPARWRAQLEGQAGAELQARLEDLVQLEIERLQEAALAIDVYRQPAGDAPA